MQRKDSELRAGKHVSNGNNYLLRNHGAESAGNRAADKKRGKSQVYTGLAKHNTSSLLLIRLGVSLMITEPKCRFLKFTSV